MPSSPLLQSLFLVHVAIVYSHVSIVRERLYITRRAVLLSSFLAPLSCDLSLSPLVLALAYLRTECSKRLVLVFALAHWGQVVVFPPGTLQGDHKEMDSVPAMNPPGTLQIHFEFPTQFTSDDPSWDMHSTLTVFQVM